MNEQQTMDLLEKIENKNLMETRKIIAVALDQPLAEAQSVKPQKDESFVIHTTLTKEQYEAFRKTEGGSDDILNLRLMCAIHNRDRHRVRMAADSQCN